MSETKRPAHEVILGRFETGLKMLLLEKSDHAAHKHIRKGLGLLSPDWTASMLWLLGEIIIPEEVRDDVRDRLITIAHDDRYADWHRQIVATLEQI
jgi:hypothetical protein